MKPVIVLAFSNDRDRYLEMINRERKNIFKTLQDHHDKGHVQVHQEASASIEDLFDTFNRYQDKIVIFHYGGHAGSSCLQLEAADGSPQVAHAGGLAQLMGQQKQLQLVFLNGCATLKQVNRLLSAGVGAVIATSVPIEDAMAVEFAEQFYNALAGQAAIQKAFDAAKAFIASKYGPAKKVNRYNRLALREKIEQPPADEFPWGLYYDENRPKILDWKLPTSNRDTVIIRGGDVHYPAGVEVNTRLIQTLFNEITNRYQVPKPEKMDFRSMRQTVIDNYPAPVGEQLRVLFQGSTTDIPRLKQSVITYNTAIQLLCFTLLSQLWDARVENPKLSIHEDYLVEINSFFALGPADYPLFDYVKFIEALAAILAGDKIDCFIADFSAVIKSQQDKDDFYKAYRFMEEMKQEVHEDHINAAEIQGFCVQAEERLGTILKQLAFLVRCKLTTIKRIEVMKRRHQKARFNHNKVTLDRVTAGLEDEAEAYETYTENNAVILMKNMQDVACYLNLSPFIIDENALTGNKCSKIFFYSHHEIVEGKPAYHYRFSDNPEEKLLVSEKNYPEVKEQFDEFKEIMFK